MVREDWLIAQCRIGAIFPILVYVSLVWNESFVLSVDKRFWFFGRSKNVAGKSFINWEYES